MDNKLKEFFEELGAGIEVPPKATVFPSMTAQGEKELLYRLGRQHFRPGLGGDRFRHLRRQRSPRQARRPRHLPLSQPLQPARASR